MTPALGLPPPVAGGTSEVVPLLGTGNTPVGAEELPGPTVVVAPFMTPLRSDTCHF